MRKYRKFLLIALWLLLGVCLLAATDIQKVRLQLKWKHQFQFAGYYAAIEKGFYRDAGIDVTLLEATANETPFDAVFNGKAEFGTCTTDVLIARSQGMKAVVLANIYQHSPHIIISLKDSNIRYVQNLVGKKIAAEPGAADLYAFLLSEGVTLDRFNVEELNYSMEKFISGKVDAITAYSTDEIFPLIEAGYEINILWPTSSGIDFYGDLLFTSEDLIKKDPVLVDKFTKASLAGWQYALDNKEELVNLIYSKYSKRHSLDHLRFEAAETEKLILPNVVTIGYTNPGRWISILESYKKLRRIDGDMTIDGMLYQDYIAQKVVIPWKLIAIFSVILLIVSAFSVFYYFTGKKLKLEIAQRIKIQSKLAASEALYSSILRASPDDITVTDLKGNIRMLSPAALKMLGATDEKPLIGQSVDIFIHPLDRDRARNNIALMFEGIFTGPSEFRLMRLDGTFVFAEINGEFIKDANDEPTGLVFVVRDIQDRKRREKELREAKEHFEFIFKTNPDPAILTRLSDGKVLDVNDAYLHFTDFTKADVLGKTTIEMHLWADIEDRNRLQIELLDHGYCNNLTATFLKKDGTSRTGMISSKLIHIQSVPHMLSSIRDVTAQKAIENEIKEKNAELTRLNIEKDKFFSIIAHDLRSPFNAFLGITNILSESIETMTQEEIRDLALGMNKSANNLFTLLENLLEWAKIKRGLSTPMPKNYQVASVIENNLWMLHEAIRAKNISVHNQIPQDLMVYADSPMIETILRNLISNAIKYTPKDGKIVLDGNKTTDNNVQIRITDTGIGMTKIMIDNLFKIDINTNRPGTEGETSAGLGLILCKEFVEINAGTIEIQSIPNQGSTFTLTLPAAKPV
ncbi:MAG: hypothetical protein CVU48_00330 [Candidatus Cloacimonetes bacterium HGW-Cloacimonetes-1]|jgi:PAS domain S-box-containing protein|nr:MAG: hypothetical protein CVU48_00330 [Candidatus Cloacimonetes bacterium HGW-Cloacimonetes-1]